jgi:hypothetical protein
METNLNCFTKLFYMYDRHRVRDHTIILIAETPGVKSQKQRHLYNRVQ